MPRLWTRTIEDHRREVRDAILDATASIVAARGLLGVTMSRVAGEAGIGRATLYRYFADVASILSAWHERQIADHLGHLARIRERSGSPGRRLAAVLSEYAQIRHETRTRHAPDLGALLHREDLVDRAEREMRRLIRGLVTEAAANGEVRDDVGPDELTDYCLHALTAADRAMSRAAVGRVVDLTLEGLSPPRRRGRLRARPI